MLLPTIILATLFGSEAIASTTQQRWTTGRNATGLTDPNVSICTYWVNDIFNATCEEVESHFDIDFNHLHAWNPSLLKDYCTLIDGWSYCVDGPAVTTDTTANATAPVLYMPSTTTGASATTSSSGTVSTSASTPQKNGGASPTEVSVILIQFGLLVFGRFWV